MGIKASSSQNKSPKTKVHEDVHDLLKTDAVTDNIGSVDAEDKNKHNRPTKVPFDNLDQTVAQKPLPKNKQVESDMPVKKTKKLVPQKEENVLLDKEKEIVKIEK